MKILGLQLSAGRSALPYSLAVWLALALVAFGLLRLPLLVALWAGLVALAIHWFSEIWHDLGHAAMAQRVGHPMIGMRQWLIFAMTMYPQNEGELPARVHVLRALGGPIASALLTLVFAMLLPIPAQGSVPWWLVLFGVLENLFVFTLQMFVPLGFNDGATLWKWVPRLLRTAQA